METEYGAKLCGVATQVMSGGGGECVMLKHRIVRVTTEDQLQS